MVDKHARHREKSEFWIWLGLAIPVALTNIARTGCSLTDIAILGHYTSTNSTLYLFASSMAGIWASLSMVAVWQGFAGALSTLMSQAWGAHNFRLIGLWLQTGLLVCTLLAALIGTSWIFSGTIMKQIIGFDTTTSDLVNHFGRWSLLGLLPMTWFVVVNNWLLSQKIVRPQLIASVGVVVCNVGLNYGFIYGLNLGFKGSPLATSCTRILLVVVIVLYLLATRAYEKTWFGWSCEALNKKRLIHFLELAIPLGITGLLEEGQLQVVAILAGKLPGDKTVNVATHNGIFMCFWVLTSIMWGVTAATRTRVAHHLGAGSIIKAKRVILIASKCAIAVGVLVASAFTIGRQYVGRFFSNDPRVWALTERIAILVGGSYAGLVVFYISMAILSAQGRPSAVAVSFAVGAWGVCIPCAVIFGFYLEATKGLYGLWLAMVCGYLVVTLLAAYFVWVSDWKLIIKETLIRTEKNDANEVNDISVSVETESAKEPFLSA